MVVREQVRTQRGVSSSNVLTVVDIFAVDALVLLSTGPSLHQSQDDVHMQILTHFHSWKKAYEIAQGEFRAKNSTKPNDYLGQAIWQNCPAGNTIHIAM